MNKYLLTPDVQFIYTKVRILSKFSLVNQIVLLGSLTIVWVRGYLQELSLFRQLSWCLLLLPCSLAGMSLSGSSAYLKVCYTPLMYVQGERDLVNLVSFWDFLRFLNCLCPELMNLPSGWNILSQRFPHNINMCSCMQSVCLCVYAHKWTHAVCVHALVCFLCLFVLFVFRDRLSLCSFVCLRTAV